MVLVLVVVPEAKVEWKVKAVSKAKDDPDSNIRIDQPGGRLEFGEDPKEAFSINYVKIIEGVMEQWVQIF